jgi:hypothetical protein
MSLRKINNFAFELALALAFAGAPALSSLSVVQAQIPSYPQQQWGPGYPPQQTMMQGNLFNVGYQSGSYDARWGQGFHPCRHQTYQQMDNPYARRAFIRGYLQGFFGSGFPNY